MTAINDEILTAPRTQPVGADLQNEVERLLYDEASLLDQWRLDDWLKLFTDDARYLMPTLDFPQGRSGKDVVFIDDDRRKLQARVERLKSRFAHREYPSSRTRRLVTNVRVLRAIPSEPELASHIVVDAAFAIYRFRRETAVYVGRYQHQLVRHDGELKIQYRRAVLDLEKLEEHGAVSIII